LKYDKEMLLEKEKGRWRLIWQDDIVLPNFQRGKQVIVNVGSLPVSNIYTKDGILVAKSGYWPFITIVPRLIHDWQTTLVLLGAVNGRADNWDLIKRVVPDEYSIAIDFAKMDYNKTDMDLLSKLPGVEIIQLPHTVLLERYRTQKELIEAVDHYIKSNYLMFFPRGKVIISDNSDRESILLIDNGSFPATKDAILSQTLKEIITKNPN
jgi:hypothetical protein